MRFLLVTHIQNARDSLRANRMRTALTITGVTIGVSSIVAILALGDGASQVVRTQVDSLGGNIAVVRPAGARTQTLDEFTLSQTNQEFAASTISQADILAIEKQKNISAVAPIMTLSGSFKTAGSSVTDGTTVATTPDFIKISQFEIRDGQFLDPLASDTTAVMGVQMAIDLFGTEQAIGKVFTFRGTSFRVIGVLERLNEPLNYNGIDFDKAVFIPFSTGVSLNQGNVQIQQINVMANSVANLERVIIDLRKSLLSRHDNETDFVVLTGTDIAQPTSQMFFAVASVTAAIAAISLLVGGVGIMNIMLVNVAERSREVGIRKALGATHGDIAWQFLVESFIMAILGGIAGCAFGYAIAFVLSTFLTFSPAFSWAIVGIGLGTSAVVGTLFGLYPALRAARKDPIESLGHYG